MSIWVRTDLASALPGSGAAGLVGSSRSRERRESKWDEGASSALETATAAVSSSSNLDSTGSRRRRSGWDEGPDQTSTQGPTCGAAAAAVPVVRDPVERVLWMMDKQIGKMIGRNGCNINCFREQTQTSIIVGPNVGAGGAEVFFSGNRESVDRAEAMVRSFLATEKCPLQEEQVCNDGEGLAALKEQAAKTVGKTPHFVGVRDRRKLRLDRRLQELVRSKKTETSWIAISEGRTDVDIVSDNTKERDPQVMLNKFRTLCAGLWKKSQREGRNLTQAEDVGHDAARSWQARWNLKAPTLSELEEISSDFRASIAAMKEKNDKQRFEWIDANPRPKRAEKDLASLGDAQLLDCLRAEGWATIVEDQFNAGHSEGVGEENAHDEQPPNEEHVSSSSNMDSIGSRGQESIVKRDEGLDKTSTQGATVEEDQFDAGHSEGVWEEEVHDEDHTVEKDAADVGNGTGSGDEPFADEWEWVAGVDRIEGSGSERTQRHRWHERRWRAHERSPRSSGGGLASDRQLRDVPCRRAASRPVGERRKERSRSPEYLRNVPWRSRSRSLARPSTFQHRRGNQVPRRGENSKRARSRTPLQNPCIQRRR